MRAFSSISPGWGIAVVRIMAGIILVAAGWSKLWAGLGGFTSFIAQLGLPAPNVLGPGVAILELLGGVLLLLGVGTRVLGLLFMIEFIVTTALVRLPAGNWDMSRIDLMMLAASVLFLLAGGGKLSVDEMFVRRRGLPRDEALSA
jgi:putative oxidoreductase